MLGQLFNEFGLTLLNDGTHTRICPSTGYSSALDLSLCSHSLGSQLSWMVHNDFCGSVHLPTVISLNRAPPVSTCRPRWKYEQADWNEIFHAFTIDPLNFSDGFVKRLFQIASNHIPRSSGAPGRKSVPWWNFDVHSAVKLRRKKKNFVPFRDCRRRIVRTPKYSQNSKLLETLQEQQSNRPSRIVGIN